MTVYITEEWTAEESDILRRYFTNLDGPVFALVNLPEVVKGALFARYSRSSKSLRRLFIDEFVGDLDIAGDASIDATVGLKRAEELYDRVFFEYGDDSVAQLGGVHLACEQASNLLTKVLEWGRLAAYLEQSTRYIAYDTRIGGRYRYYRDPEVLGSPLGLRYIGDMDRLFDTYAELVPLMSDFFREQFPKDPADSDFVYRQAIRAKAFDSVRGVLPAASLSNVGIYGTGQAYEALLLRMRAHPLPEARAYADLMLTELRKVIPSFLKRIDVTDRGLAWSTYMAATRTSMQDLASRLLPADLKPDDGPLVRLIDFDPDAEVKLVASILYPYTHVPEHQLEARAREMSVDERIAVIKAYVGERSNRRHKPGRALERPTLPVRRAGRLRRVPRPAAAPDADDRLADAQPAPWVRATRHRRPRRARRSASRRRWSARRRCTTCSRSGSPHRPRTPCRSRTRCASTCTSTRARRCT